MLRARLRAERARFVAALPPDPLIVALAALHDRLRPLLQRSGGIAGYAAHRGEPDILPFLLDAYHAGRPVALPHVDAAGAMRFAAWHPHAALTPGHAGIAQPEATAAEIEPAILLVPLVGFDRAGRRLGQGGGFYDRWFAAHPDGYRIGVAWSVQEVPALPVDPWDMPLHAIATEREWIVP